MIDNIYYTCTMYMYALFSWSSLVDKVHAFRSNIRLWVMTACVQLPRVPFVYNDVFYTKDHDVVFVESYSIE